MMTAPVVPKVRRGSLGLWIYNVGTRLISDDGLANHDENDGVSVQYYSIGDSLNVQR